MYFCWVVCSSVIFTTVILPSSTRERYRHRDEPSSPPSDRHRKHIHSRSGSRERKRRRVEEEKERRTDGASSSRERAVNLSRSRDAEEMSTDRHEEEKGEEELLKPAWIRCTHAENYYSNDPMDQVVIRVVNTNSRRTYSIGVRSYVGLVKQF